MRIPSASSIWFQTENIYGIIRDNLSPLWSLLIFTGP